MWISIDFNCPNCSLTKYFTLLTSHMVALTHIYDICACKSLRQTSIRIQIRDTNLQSLRGRPAGVAHAFIQYIDDRHVFIWVHFYVVFLRQRFFDRPFYWVVWVRDQVHIHSNVRRQVCSPLCTRVCWNSDLSVATVKRCGKCACSHWSDHARSLGWHIEANKSWARAIPLYTINWDHH